MHITFLSSVLVLLAMITATATLPLSRHAAPAAVAPAAIRADAPVEYTVSLHHAHTQMVDITMCIRGIRPGELELALPVWRPGRYVVSDPAGTLRDITARGGSGKPLAIRKATKSSWLVDVTPDAEDEVIISYRVYCNSIADRTRHADDSHAFLSPATVFMYAPALRDQPLRIRIDAPDDWSVATGLEPDPQDASSLLATNYDVLVDSPLEIGRHQRLTFDVEGTPHELIIWNPTLQQRTLSDERLIGDFSRIVQIQRDIFNTLPYSRYVFLIHAYPGGGGGTEHLNSTIMQTTPAALRDEEPYKRFLGLVSHEFFHTWNVKQFRPAGLHPYDYQRENYTNLLWLVEGTTSYYDDLCLVRAGIIKPDDYLRTLSTAIDNLRRRPGALVQSLEESSFDAWIKFNKSTPDSINSTVSFYDKGALASLLLDILIRRHSDNQASLDDVMRELYRRFPLSGPGYTRADVIEIAQARAGADLSDFFATAIAGTADLPFEAVLDTLGLELHRGDTKDQAADESKLAAYIGLNLESRDGFTAVSTVLADGPAYAAGLLPGDIITAINDQRLRSPGDLTTFLRAVKPGQELTITYFRHDVQRQVQFSAAARSEARWNLRRLSSPTAAQQQAYSTWLNQPWPGTTSSSEPEARPRRRGRNP